MSDSAAAAPAPRRANWWWFGFCLAVLTGTGFWALRMVAEHSLDEQRAIVPLSTTWGMHACLAVGVTALAGLALTVGGLLGRRRLFTGLGLAVLGYFAVGLAPNTTRIFYDEHIYMQIAQTLAHTGRAEYATYARVEYGEFTAYQSWVNKQPNGHPYLLSWAFRLAGASEEVAHQTERVAVGLTAALLYFALALAPLTLPAVAPVLVPLCFIFTPVVLWWGHTAAVEPTASLTTVAALLAASLHARLRDPATGEGRVVTGALLAATAAFAAYFRPESLLVFPLVASVLWAADRRFLEDRTTWAAFALSVALLTPGMLHLWSVHTEDWGATDGRRFDVAFLQKNLASNVGYFVQGNWYPLAGTVLGLFGAVWLAVRSGWLAVSAGVWFALSWGIFVLFYAGGYYYGASSRYAVVSAAPVALFVGVGAAALFGRLRRHPAALGAVAVVVLMNWVAAMHIVPTLGRESNEARADVDFVHEVAPTLPTGSLVVAVDSCLWTLNGRNAAQLDNVEGMLRTEMREMARQYPGGIYLHWDYWVNCQPHFADVWRQLILDTRATVVVRKNAEAVKFALFRLDTPYALKTLGGQYHPGKTPLSPDDVTAEVAAANRAVPEGAPPASVPVTPP